MIRQLLIRPPLALLLLLVIPSCSRQSPLTTQPEVSTSAMRAEADVARSQLNREPGEFFPLAVGNRWTYEFKRITEVMGADGNLIERSEETHEQQHSIDCSFQAEGNEWFIQRIHVPGQPPLLRALHQDRSGLHGLEFLNTIDPCASSSIEGRLSVEELRYPLRPGSTWVRDEQFFSPTVVTVESHEVIETPAGRFPAVRLHVRYPAGLPIAPYFAWYGREGLLAVEYRTEAAISGTSGHQRRSTTTIRLKSVSVARSLASTTARPGRR